MASGDRRPPTGALLLMAFVCANIYCFVNDTRRVHEIKLQELVKAAKPNSDPKGEHRAHPSANTIPEPVPELSQRVCGSPAVDGIFPRLRRVQRRRTAASSPAAASSHRDRGEHAGDCTALGYSHVVPSCLESSPTAKWWAKWKAAGGQAADLVVHIEHEADYDGLAVGWGINNKKQTIEECAEACRNHVPGPHVGGPFQNLPCNAFCWCPTSHDMCFEPDAHKHTAGDCWLKFTEGPANPEVNFRGAVSQAARIRHPTAPMRVQWTAGVLLPPGTSLGNGTFGPRYHW